MKELEFKKVDKTEFINENKKDIQKVFLGNIKPCKNHILFEVNKIDKTIEIASFDKQIVFVLNQKKVNKSITTKRDCVYISALNKKNVLKILKRDFGIIF